MGARGWALALWSLTAVAAPQASAMRAGLIDEPVFGGQAYVEETGAAHRPTVLLIHGIGEMGARDWNALGAVLARDYHVVAVDLPGFGRSTRANKAYTPANYVAFVKHVAGRYARAPFHLVGHSMGGAIALRYAATYPDDIRTLVVADVVGILHRLTYSQYLVHLGIRGVPNVYPDQAEHLRNLVGSVLGFFERLRPDPAAMLSTPAMRRHTLQGDPVKIAGLAVVLDDFTSVIERVQAPTLVLWGERDALAPLRTAKVLVRRLAFARLSILDSAGHTPMEDAPEAFNAEVLAHLRAPLPAAGPAVGTPAPVPANDRTGRCQQQRGRVFTGDYRRIVVVGCRGVVLRDVRVGELRITDASVAIEGSRIGGADGGLYVDDADVTLTASTVEGEVAITALDSRLDLAGVSITGRRAAVQAPRRSRLLFSVSRVTSPRTHAAVHGLVEVGPRSSL